MVRRATFTHRRFPCLSRLMVATPGWHATSGMPHIRGNPNCWLYTFGRLRPGNVVRRGGVMTKLMTSVKSPKVLVFLSVGGVSPSGISVGGGPPEARSPAVVVRGLTFVAHAH